MPKLCKFMDFSKWVGKHGNVILSIIKITAIFRKLMTTLAGGFLVTNYHNPGDKVSKSNLDRGRKQKRPLRQTAVGAWRG